MASQQEFAHSASVSFGVNCGGSGVNYAGARASEISGSGSGSGTGFDFEELAAKRGCYEPSINNSGSDGSNPADVTGFMGFYGSSGMAMAPAEQQQQGPQAAQLGAWFASQQRQQQQLQLQMQATLQLQQQVQMQIQHQVAAHMSMQQAAGQVMHMQQPSLTSPYAGIGSPVASAPAAPAGFSVMAADLGSPFAGAGTYNTSRTAAAAAAAAAMAAVAANAANAANTGMPYQQLQQLQDLRLRQSASPVAAAAGDAAADCTMQAQLAPQVQQQVMQPNAGFASCQGASQKPCDHVVPEVDTQAAQLQQQQDAAAAPAGGFRVPQLNLNVPASSMQPSPAADEIDSLLTKAGRDMFELDDLAAAGIDGIDGIDGMGEMDADAIAAACGLDSGGDACSSGNNSSLCESMADELAVAGLEAEDAAGYYMFGGAGSPREQQQQLQQQGAAAGTVAKATGAAASAACEDASQLAGAGFKVAQAPCESSFAHMFDFY
jgi:hypothetical protein